ncbi:hypothetical protein RclHR1_00370016 [Rhizophagus clarus]|uniref:Myb-like domain-containing protein n=1 Tax=Rhizophagus clarus TaxID=94130 RepID=A0A2Z6RBY3_9GLOM|nr:hypothetical protein RclHR1_00370016 [Rhizophagus clarus]
MPLFDENSNKTIVHVCLDALENEEKNFIVEWIQKHRTSSGVIHWKYVVNDLKLRFGKRHSENKVKNYWNSRRKTYLRKSKNEKQKQRKFKSQEQEEFSSEKHEFIFHFVTSEDFFLPKSPKAHSKISIASLLNYNNL